MSGIEDTQNILAVIWLWLPLGLQIAAFFLTLTYSLYLAQQHELSVAHMFVAGLVGIIGAMLGGRVWVELLSTGSIDILSMIWNGPRGVIGVMLGAALCASVYLKLRGQSVIAYADVALPSILIGYMIARLGCLAAGDDFGIPTNALWGINFGPNTEVYQSHLSRGWIEANSRSSLTVYPTQIYHFLSAAVAFAILKSGVITVSALRIIFAVMFYAVTRFFIQYYRDDHFVYDAIYDQTQWFCILLITLGCILWIKNKIIKRSNKISFAIEASS